MTRAKRGRKRRRSETWPRVEGAVPVDTIGRLADLLGRSPQSLEDLATRAQSLYRPFDVPKRSGGTRTIHNPSDELKRAQRQIRERLLAKIKYPGGVLGGVRERSATDHAERHLGQRYLALTDIKDCFGSICHRTVYKVWRDRLGCAPDAARFLTMLTTYKKQLPQGAPTSTDLANLALLALYADLESLAIELELQFSIYVDDLAFSGERADEVLDRAIRLIRLHGYNVKAKKGHLYRRTGPQEIAGFRVDGPQLAFPRRTLREIEDRIHELATVDAVFEKDLLSLQGRINRILTHQPAPGIHLQKLARDLVEGYE